MKRKNLYFILPFVLVALIAVMALTGCNGKPAQPPSQETLEEQAFPSQESTPSLSHVQEAQDIGQGETVFRFEAKDDAGTVTAWNVHTDETTVGAALLGVGLIEGESSDFGLYVKKVNGLTADYDTDKAYWAFYVDGEYAMAGADATNIEHGKTYEFVYTKD